MLKPVPMAKIVVVGPKTKLAETVDTLHRLNAVHIEDYVGTHEFFELGTPLPEGSKISERLLRLRGVLKGAQLQAPADARPFTRKNLQLLDGKLKEVEDELAHLVEERAKVLDALKAVDEEAALLGRIVNLSVPTARLVGFQSVVTLAGFVSREADLAQLQGLGAGVDWVESMEAEGRFLVVLSPNELERSVQEALAKMAFQPLELPISDRPPRDQVTALAARREDLVTQEASLGEKIHSIGQQHAAAFYAMDEHLSIEADKTTAPVRFTTSANAFLIEGWIPHDRFARIEQALARATSNQVYVTRIKRAALTGSHGPAHEHSEHHGEDTAEETVPVMLKNPNASGPYELLTDTYSRPKYSEVDPTLFMFFGFPLFYGLMLGDIGYGILLLVMVYTGAFNWLFKLFGFQSKWHLNKIFVHSAISSILFGVLYTEFFGLELLGHHGVLSHYETHLGPIPYPLSRFVEVKLLLAITLLIGALHMLIGLVVGLRNAAAEHGLGDALKHRGSWLGILLGVTLAGIAVIPDTLQLGHGEGAVVEHPLPLLVAAGAFFLVGVVLLIMGEGAIGLLELPTVISNLLSYSRLLAIGLSSAGIALAGNKIAGLIFDAGGVMIAVGVLVVVLTHFINLLLGIIGPALHSLRLHYVEFFTKFYSGGGVPYQPFGAQRKYTIQEVKQA